jgi:hypothetical protein
MAAASVTKSIVHLEEDFYLNSALPIKGFYQATVTITTPTQGAASTAAAVLSSSGTVASGSITGVALGDIVIGVAPTTALPTGQILTGATITATDVVTFSFDSTGATTGASRTFNVIVADLT